MLVYKTFMVSDKHVSGNSGTRRVRFSLDHPTQPMTEDDKLEYSYKLLGETAKGGNDSLLSVHPVLFRNLNYMAIVSPDVIEPKSEEVRRAFDLEQYDRMMANPVFDQQATGKLLLQAYDRTKKDPDKYIAKQPSQVNAPPPPPAPIGAPTPAPAGNAPIPTPQGTRPIIPNQ